MTLPYALGPEFNCLDAKDSKMKLPRYVVMCIPGRLDDGSDSGWFILDRRTDKSVFVGDGDAMRKVAAQMARDKNASAKRRGTP